MCSSFSRDEQARAKAHLESLGLDFSRPIIGLNTGAGERWPLKQWREDGYVELVDRLSRRSDAQFLLLGGPSEAARNERLKAQSQVRLFDPGCDNPLRHFAGFLDCCDVVVSGDTLAMHLSLALGKRTVVVFGPTSAAEIELYGLGEKVVPDMTCLSCYKTSCDFVPNCMDLISTTMVEDAVMRQLRIVRPSIRSQSRAPLERQHVEPVVLQLEPLFRHVLNAVPAVGPRFPVAAVLNRLAPHRNSSGSERGFVYQRRPSAAEQWRNDHHRADAFALHESQYVAGGIQRNRFDFANRNDLNRAEVRNTRHQLRHAERDAADFRIVSATSRRAPVPAVRRPRFAGGPRSRTSDSVVEVFDQDGVAWRDARVAHQAVGDGEAEASRGQPDHEQDQSRRDQRGTSTWF